MASIGTATGHERTTLRLPLRLLGDDRLARMAARGERRAFEAMFARYHRELYRYCRAIVGEPEEANDALQSTMATALHHLPRAERRSSLRGWLYRVAHNESVSILRRRTVPLDPLRLPEGVAPGADVHVEQRERLRQLVGDLRALPDRQRAALLMRELSGLSYAQIADALETSQGAARQLVYEARESLRDAGIRRGEAIKMRRADFSVLFPPLGPAAASGALASLLGGLRETGVGSTGSAALGGAGVKAASIASVLVLGAGAAGIGGGLKSPFGPGSDPPPARAATGPSPAADPNPTTSESGGSMVAAAAVLEHTGRSAQAPSNPGRQSSHGRSAGGTGGSQSQGRAVRNHGQATQSAHPVGPPATPPGQATSSSAGGTPTPASSGSPPPTADQGLTQAATAQATSHTTAAAAPAQASVQAPQTGGNPDPPGRISK